MSSRVTSAAPPSVVFLDRDGTIIQDVHYLSKPEQVVLLDGAAHAIARLNHAGIPVVLVTNQSGIARGYFTVDDYERGHRRLVELLAEHGAHLDAAYYCPHHPDEAGPCTCRKPASLLFRQAIAEHALDMSNAIYIGDRWRDLAPMTELGGRGILVPSTNTPPGDIERAHAAALVLPSLSEAITLLLGPESNV